ncbi:MAG: hypothetical protein ACKKMW_00710 [Candidatus Nealsonbacteria bacterium]
MRKILKIIFVLFFLILFPFLVQATCTNPVSPSDGETDIDPSVPIKLDWCDDVNANSYHIQIYKGGNLRYGQGTTTASEITIPNWLGIFTGLTTYEWEFAACANDDYTNCGTGCDDDEPIDECADFSERWSFTTKDVGLVPPELIEPFYDPANPSEIPVVNMDDLLGWSHNSLVSSYIYEVKKDTNITIGPVNGPYVTVSFDDIWDSLECNTTYNWHTKSCYNEDGTNCSEFSETWFFKTTGAPPVNLSADNSIIPVKINWDDVYKAVSYVYEVSENNSFGETNIVIRDSTIDLEASVDYYPGETYPGLVQNTQYWWRVKPCVDKQSSYCGTWSSIQDFTTFRLSAPCVFDGVLDENCPSPEIDGTLYTYQKSISWQSVEGAKAYKYKIDYATKDPEEADETCIAGQPLVEGITTNHSARPPLKCLGTYNWWLRSCLDTSCIETSILSPMLNFTFIQPIPPAQFGLVPCGRVSDSPETPWNERDPCEIKHIFLLLKNIIDFVLWRVGLIALALLIIFTAVTSYFSLGAPGTIVNVKQIWQRAGTGYLIMFLAWWIINIIVNIIGFTDTWWSLPF